MLFQLLRINLIYVLGVDSHIEGIIIVVIHQWMRCPLDLRHCHIGTHQLAQLLYAALAELHIVETAGIQHGIQTAAASIRQGGSYRCSYVLSKSLLCRLALLFYGLFILIYTIHMYPPYLYA